jgi:manganese/iron transport system permease protein
MLFIAGTLGATTAAGGAYLSYFVNGSTGGCIVVLQTLGFLAAWIFAPRHGVLGARWRRQHPQAPRTP